jgi:hypothetical protein
MMGMMGNAMMSALTSTYSPLRLLRTSPGGGATGGLEQALRWRHSSSTQEAGEAVTNVGRCCHLCRDGSNCAGCLCLGLLA